MKTIYLMRHAKSSWEKAITDHKRPLKKRGRKAAKRVGEYLREKGIEFDLIISSDAARAIETVDILRKSMKADKLPVKKDPNLYEASENDILDIIEELDDDMESVLLVAHNPGISRTAVYLSCDSELDWLPTAAFTGIEADINSWTEIRKKRGNLVYFITPRSLDAEL